MLPSIVGSLAFSFSLALATPAHNISPPEGLLARVGYVQNLGCYSIPDMLRFFPEVYDVLAPGSPALSYNAAARKKAIACAFAGDSALSYVGRVTGPEGQFKDAKYNRNFQLIHYMVIDTSGRLSGKPFDSHDIYMVEDAPEPPPHQPAP
jgi:hypothetical protein